MSIGQSLVDSGNKVTVLTSFPSYKSEAVKSEALEKISEDFFVKRMHLFYDKKKNIVFKLLNMMLFSIRVFLHILFNRSYDVVMISTAPPILAGFAVALACKLKNTKFIYHCMDIHPEIGSLSGEFGNPLIFGLLQTMDNWTCKQACKVVVLSGDMERSLLERKKMKDIDIKIINNFPLPENGDKSIRKNSDYLKEDGKFRVIFAGNIGRFQGLPSFIDAVKLLGSHDGFELVFVGEGSSLKDLQQMANELPNQVIKFIPHVSISEIKIIIANSDLGVVSLSPKIINYAYPSKTMTYLEQGCPVLVSVEKDSELAKFVEDKCIGFSCAPGDLQALRSVFLYALKNKEKVKEMGKNAKFVSNSFFSEKTILADWKNLMLEVGS
jgi:glycosyltransferase involved in cell wall biosynthesis